MIAVLIEFRVRGMAAGKRDVFADYRIVAAAVERGDAFAHAAAAAD